MSKPEPQKLGVTGIEATPITMNEQPDEINVDDVLLMLSNHPPFQMFINERHKTPEAVEDSQQFALNKAKEAVFLNGFDKLASDYEKWHFDKGYWPNETPHGNTF